MDYLNRMQEHFQLLICDLACSPWWKFKSDLEEDGGGLGWENGNCDADEIEMNSPPGFLFLFFLKISGGFQLGKFYIK